MSSGSKMPHRMKRIHKRVVAVAGDVVKIKPGYVLVGESSFSHVDLRTQLSAMGTGRGRVDVKLNNDRVLVNGQLVSNEEVAAAVGDPNGKVKVIAGKVIINGKPLNEPYVGGSGRALSSGRALLTDWIVVDKQKDQAVKSPEGKLLVLGDNRNESNDARYWGLLDRQRVLGKAMFIFWPLNRIRWVR